MRIIFSVLLIVIALIPQVYAAPSVAQKKHEIVIGTAALSGTYYASGVAMCALANKNIENMQCSVQSTPGAVYNINSVLNGDFTFGLAQTDWLYAAIHGMQPAFDAPHPDLRVVMYLQEEKFVLFANALSGVVEFDDLAGKRVSMGSPGSGGNVGISTLFREKGWDKRHFKTLTRLKGAEQADALCDRKIDAGVDFIAHPSAAIKETMARCKINLIEIPDYLIDGVRSDIPLYKNTVIDKSIYDTERDIRTYSVVAVLMTHKDTPDYLVESLLTPILNNIDQLKVHPSLAHLALNDSVLGGPEYANEKYLPLHPAAKKVYQKFGILKK